MQNPRPNIGRDWDARQDDGQPQIGEFYQKLIIEILSK